jgi:hypothetical protein
VWGGRGEHQYKNTHYVTDNYAEQYFLTINNNSNDMYLAGEVVQHDVILIM